MNYQKLMNDLVLSNYFFLERLGLEEDSLEFMFIAS